jgi:hypothetical protein
MSHARSARVGRYQQKAQPEGKVRKSQVVTTYGPGAMVDLIDDAVLVGGLDFWRFDPKTGPITIVETRLREALAERFQKSGRTLRRDDAFREPPAGNDQSPDPRCGVQVLEFPQWFVCQKPDCRALSRASDGLELKGGRYLHQCGRAWSATVPVRFVMACKRGHLDDFPWLGFAHQGRPICAAPALRLLEGATGDFTQIRVACEGCGLSRPMSDANIEDKNPTCRGHRPWLGSEGREECTENQRLLVRTASNSYFAQTVSALSIPDPFAEVREKVESVWDMLQVADERTLDTFLLVPKVKDALRGLPRAEILAAIDTLKRGESSYHEPLRTAEFRQFLAQKQEKYGDLPQPDETFFARIATPHGGLPRGVSRLVLAHKLREVRVQVGFTRLESATPDLQGEYDLGVRSAPLGLLTDWLPATEVRGEGIFVQLDEALVQHWEKQPAVQARAKVLLAAYDLWAVRNAVGLPFPGTRFYLLHSLAHLLIAALSLECGYAASAIRERIYCAPANDPVPMAAILLATGTSGSEGTLGGLVEQGRYLRNHLRRAHELGVLCSNDPVCAGHHPARDPTERWLEGAACHGCLFVAECSCERFNKYLDRTLVFPTLGHEGVAFFEGAP